MTNPRRSLRPVAAALLLGAATGAAQAAGGHFDVDDASLLGSGRCQNEAWFVRAPRVGASLLHDGAACRVGAFELGLNVERPSVDGSAGLTLGPQLKWSTNLGSERLAAGLVWYAALDVRHGGRAAHTFYVPATWRLADALVLNANLGIDLDAQRRLTRRIGISGEWAATATLTLLAERARFGGDPITRVGARIGLGAATSLDLSAARSGAIAANLFAVGLNHEFGR